MAHDSGVRWRPSQQQSGLLLTLTVAVTISAVTVRYWTGVPWWLFLLFFGLVAAGTPVVWFLRQKAIQADRRDETVEATVRTAASWSGGLPRVNDLTLGEFGVHRSHVQLPYVERAAQAEAAEVIRSREPLLLLGPSMVGKSRLGVELLRRQLGDRRLVVPTPPRGLAQLLSAGGTPSGAVIWLDDMERYLGPAHLRAEWLDRAMHAGNVVVATMRAAAYERFQPTRDTHPPQWEVLERFHPVWIHQNETERRHLATQVGDPRVRAALLRYGLAEYLGGGIIAIERLYTGESQHPLGAAMVRAAADCRRAGLDVVPEPMLVALAPSYLQTPARPSPSATADALTWAAEPIDQTVSLLESAPGGWRAFDVVVDHLDDHAVPVLDAARQAVAAAKARTGRHAVSRRSTRPRSGWWRTGRRGRTRYER